MKNILFWVWILSLSISVLIVASMQGVIQKAGAIVGMISWGILTLVIIIGVLSDRKSITN